ncbi:hypothetical protein XpopCFBP1817_20955, partial [Xanthomonas populi]
LASLGRQLGALTGAVVARAADTQHATQVPDRNGLLVQLLDELVAHPSSRAEKADAFFLGYRLRATNKPLEYCLAGGKIANMTPRKEIPIALWKRIEPLIP